MYPNTWNPNLYGKLEKRQDITDMPAVGRDHHGYWKPTGFGPGLGYGFGVCNHRLAGLIRIKTPPENTINASQYCQLAPPTHSEMGIHAFF